MPYRVLFLIFCQKETNSYNMKLQIRPALKSYYLCLSPLQILKKKADYSWHLQPPRQILQRVFFKTNRLNFVVNFNGHKGKDFGIKFSTRCFKAAFSMRNSSHGFTKFFKSEHFLIHFSKAGRRGLSLLTKHASFLKDVIYDGYRSKCLFCFLHISVRKSLFTFPSPATHKLCMLFPHINRVQMNF